VFRPGRWFREGSADPPFLARLQWCAGLLDDKEEAASGRRDTFDIGGWVGGDALLHQGPGGAVGGQVGGALQVIAHAGLAGPLQIKARSVARDGEQEARLHRFRPEVHNEPDKQRVTRQGGTVRVTADEQRSIALIEQVLAGKESGPISPGPDIGGDLDPDDHIIRRDVHEILERRKAR